MGVQSELDYFTQLGHSSDAIRYRSGRKILHLLRMNQDTHSLLYVLKRLITGLGGTKLKGGCFATLVSLLHHMPDHFIDFEIYDSLIKKSLTPKRGDSKKDVGDAYLGELLAYAALIITDYLSSETSEVHQTIALRLIKISQKRSYLHQPAFVYLSKLSYRYNLTTIPDEFKTDLMDLKKYTFDKLYYLFNLPSPCKSKIVKKVLNKNYCRLMNADVCYVAEIIMENHQKVVDHPFISLYIKKLSTDLNNSNLFWDSIINEETCKVPKKSKAILTIMNSFVDNITSNDFLINTLFKKQVIKILNDSGKKEPLVKIVLKKLLPVFNKGESAIKVKIVLTILLEAECFYFDSNTGVRVIDQMIGDINVEGIKLLSESIINTFDVNKTNLNKSWNEKDKMKLFSYYLKLLMLAETRKEWQWRCKQYKILVDMGLFTTETYQMNYQLASHIRNFLCNIIGQVYPNITIHRGVLSKVLQYIWEKQAKGFELKKKLKPEVFKMWKQYSKWVLSACENFVYPDVEDLCITLQVLSLYNLISVFRIPTVSLQQLEIIQKLHHSAMIENVENRAINDLWSTLVNDTLIYLLMLPFSGIRMLVVTLFKEAVVHLNLDSLKNLINILDPEDDADEESENESLSEPSNAEKSSNILSLETPSTSRFMTLPTIDDDDNASINLDDADENEVERLNQLVGHLISLQKSKKSTKKKLTQSKSTHFQIRVIDLIEVCCKEKDSIPLLFWFKLIPVMVKLFERTSRQENEAALYQKIGSCMKKISLIQFQKVEKDQFALTQFSSSVILLLKDLLEQAEKGMSAYYRNNILNLTKPLIIFSNYCSDEDAEEISELMKIYMKAFFNSKSKFSISYFVSLCDMNWKGMNSLIKFIIKYIFYPKSKLKYRILGIQILHKYFCNNYYFSELMSNDVSRKFEEKFCKCKNEKNLRDTPKLRLKFIKGVGSLLKTMAKRDRQKHFANWDLLVKKFEIIRSGSTILNSSTNSENTMESSYLASELSDDEQIIEPKKRKRSGKFYRKQSKRLRMEAMNMDLESS